MKRLLLLMTAAFLLTAIPSCKKGENDPFLSLSTRKARLAGEYNIDSWFSTSFAEYTDSFSQELTLDITGSTGTRTIKLTPFGLDEQTTIHSIQVDQASFTFKKDGTWSSVFNKTSKWTEEVDDLIIDSFDHTAVETMSESGSWSFLGGQSDDYKNKERIVLNSISIETSSQTTTVTNYEGGGSETVVEDLVTDNRNYSEGESSVIYEIDMLKKKEMVFIQVNNSGGNQIESDGGGMTTNYSYTRNGNVKIVLSE
ncbi:MAG: hypothetical protein GQ574_00545 [Crocinitomix sp.]|nr:hypothetical protein [Crocinitomix sp.]